MPLQDANPTPSFGGFGLNETRDVEMKSRAGLTFVSAPKRNRQNLGLLKPKPVPQPQRSNDGIPAFAEVIG